MKPRYLRKRTLTQRVNALDDKLDAFREEYDAHEHDVKPPVRPRGRVWE